MRQAAIVGDIAAPATCIPVAHACRIWHTDSVAQRPGKTLVILSGEIKTPPLSTEARREAGFFLRRLQQGELISPPHSRPMTKAIGPRCHELRIQDEDATWRIMYRIDTDELLIIDVFSKKTQKTPASVIGACKARLKNWDES